MFVPRQPVLRLSGRPPGVLQVGSVLTLTFRSSSQPPGEGLSPALDTSHEPRLSPVFLAIGPSNHRLLRSTKLKETLYLCLPVCAKGCNPGTPRWKRCVGQVTGKAAPGSASALPPGAPALSPRYFYEGRLNHWPLMVELNLSAPFRRPWGGKC